MLLSGRHSDTMPTCWVEEAPSERAINSSRRTLTVWLCDNQFVSEPLFLELSRGSRKRKNKPYQISHE